MNATISMSSLGHLITLGGQEIVHIQNEIIQRELKDGSDMAIPDLQEYMLSISVIQTEIEKAYQLAYEPGSNLPSLKELRRRFEQ